MGDAPSHPATLGFRMNGDIVSEDRTESEPPLPSTNELARQRTTLAAERTLYAVLRTGLAIAAGGPVIISVLGDEWPTWIKTLLAVAFLAIGYVLLLLGLSRYRALATAMKRQGAGEFEIISPGKMIFITVLVQVVLTVVVVLFLIGAFDSVN